MKLVSILSVLFILITENSHAEVLAVAHRGASGHAPENTMSAINKALDLGARYIEIDVHMTRDGEVVAIHDSTIDRTSNKDGKVDEYTLSQLKSFDFGSWYSSDYKGEKIPTLKEVLKVIKQRAVLIIELKYGNDRYREIEKKIVDTVISMESENFVILKSFSLHILNTFEKMAPHIRRLYCTFGGTSWITLDNFIRFKNLFDGGRFHYLQVHKFFLSDWTIQEAKRRKIKIVAWDIHDKNTIEKAKAMGVDFIETDYPDLVTK